MSDDPLATPTLANLYLAQGHALRALQIARERLEADPLDGAALAIAERVRRRTSATLELEARPGMVVVRWKVEWSDAAPPDLHLLLATVRATRFPSVRITSLPCDASAGEAEVALRQGPASGTLAIAYLDASRRLQVLAVELLPSW